MVTQVFFPTISYRSFIVFSFIFIYLIHFDLIFVQAIRSVFRYMGFFLYVDAQLSQHHLLKRLSFAPLYCFCSFVNCQLSISMWACFWALYFVPSLYLSILSPMPHCLDYRRFTVSLKVGWCQSSSSPSYYIGYSELFASPYKVS